MSGDSGRLRAARQRLVGMVQDPFYGAALRSQVPPGHVITVALAEEPIRDAVSRAVREGGGTPAFLAVDVPGREALVLVVASRRDDGLFALSSPGGHGAGRALGEGVSLGELVAALNI